MSKVIWPSTLILSSKLDISADYVVSILRKRNVQYFRLNTEDLASHAISLDPTDRRLRIESDGGSWEFCQDSLQSVFFRRPVFLREFGKRRTKWERFVHPQWSAFERSLTLFEDAYWMNHPVATYRAEIKPLQLAIASTLGWDIPRTTVGNDPNEVRRLGDSKVVMKSIDTVYIEEDQTQTFAYTQFPVIEEIANQISSAPAVYQTPLRPKVDFRVTVVGDEVFAVSILGDDDQGVSGDWRAEKGRCNYHPVTLPIDVESRCARLVLECGLTFAGIDLAFHEGRHYFLEINPTGEWCWLVDAANLPLDVAIAESLITGGRA